MKVKCEWTTCIYNSARCSFENNESMGECNCESGEIQLIENVTCDECKSEVDGLRCMSYVPKISKC